MVRLAAAILGMALSATAEQTWTIQYRYRQIDSTLTINDLAFPTATRGVACGVTLDRKGKERPLVLVTNDGGQHWSEVPTKEAGQSLFFLDDSTGWMTTDKGLWRTEESGRTWRKLKAPAGISRVWFLDREHGYAGGLEKKALETHDGGDTWTPLAILKDVQGDPTFTTFGEISFSGTMGIISGWNVPPRRGGPDWMEPESANQKREWPNLSVLLETKDAGKTWTKSEASIFGQITRVSLAPTGHGLGLIEFHNAFEYPSEVYRIDLRTGKSERSYRQKDRAITDVRLFLGSDRALIAGFETSGTMYRTPIPGKLKVLVSDDLTNWHEMPVDYRAVTHSALIAGPDVAHVWIATDTGLILKLTDE